MTLADKYQADHQADVVILVLVALIPYYPAPKLSRPASCGTRLKLCVAL